MPGGKPLVFLSSKRQNRKWSQMTDFGESDLYKKQYIYTCHYCTEDPHSKESYFDSICNLQSQTEMKAPELWLSREHLRDESRTWLWQVVRTAAHNPHKSFWKVNWDTRPLAYPPASEVPAFWITGSGCDLARLCDLAQCHWAGAVPGVGLVVLAESLPFRSLSLLNRDWEHRTRPVQLCAFKRVTL